MAYISNTCRSILEGQVYVNIYASKVFPFFKMNERKIDEIFFNTFLSDGDGVGARMLSRLPRLHHRMRRHLEPHSSQGFSFCL